MYGLEYPQSSRKSALQRQYDGGSMSISFFLRPNAVVNPSRHDCGMSTCSLFSGTWAGSVEPETELGMTTLD